MPNDPAAQDRTGDDFPPLVGIRRAAAWLAFRAVILWPFSVKQRGMGRLYWGLLPWAGLWAYHPNGGSK